MLVLVPRPESGWPESAIAFDVRHLPRALVPGSPVEGRLNVGERHLHLLSLTRPTLVTATLDRQGLELAIIDARSGRSRPMAQRLLARGLHWLEVRAHRSSRGAVSYRLRVHCVEL